MGELADLADRRAGQRGIVGCLLQACRLEVVSEGLLQVAPAGDLAGLRDGDFRSLALEGWRGGRLKIILPASKSSPLENSVSVPLKPVN